MRLIVTSDSHGAPWSLIAAAHNQPEAAAMLFLGDGEADLPFLRKTCPRLTLYAVAGNCDGYNSDLPETDLITLGGVKIIYTHGHGFAVKRTTQKLLAAARTAGAGLALFGHTHTPQLSYEDGVYLFNPGSIRAHSYGVVDITPAGVFCFHCVT